MKRLLLRAKLDIEPVTWGGAKGEDNKKRVRIRQEIKKIIPEFEEQYMERLLKQWGEVEVILNCYLINMGKDIDNLAKIPIDAVFFSAQNEKGEREKWEAKITSLLVKKLKSSQNALEIILYGASSHANSEAH